MDGGPFRVQRPADRRVVSRPEPTHRQPDESQSVETEPKTVRQVTVPRHVSKEKKSSNRLIIWIVTLIALIILGVTGWLVSSNMQTAGAAIDTSKYQAVFFANGNVYFGSLQPFSSESYKMTNVYYPQAQTSDKAKDDDQQPTTTDQSNITLLKLSDSIHGPEDEMIIAKDQVLFYQNLKSDSKVTQLIEGKK